MRTKGRSGLDIATYCYWWIRQGITRAIADKGRTIRLPIHIGDKLKKLRRVQRRLYQELGRKSDLERILHLLHPRQQQVIRLRYGLDGGDVMTLTQIAKTLDLSRERVRQLEREALVGLRNLGSQFQAYLAS